MPSAVKTLLRFFCLAILASSICTVRSIAQEVTIESNVAANPPDGGWHPWYETHVDPDNAKNMLICGSKWNAKDNASYGFVYYSADGGKTWKQALEDKSSTWVSEQSCAYGVNGVAYFVADASKVIDDELHHDLGTTRIFTSHDGGKTWKLGIETGWTDYSASVVDTKPGTNQNRLYVYFNNLQTFYHSIGQKDAEDAEKKLSTGTRLGMISYKDGDAKVAGPFSSEAMARENLHGNYPAPALMLKDGTIVTIFTTKRRTEKNEREFMVEAVRTSADRMNLEAPVKMVDSLDNPDADSSVQCGGYYLGSAGTYDPVHNKLYYAYSDVRNKKCTLLLTASTDGGKSWSKAQPIRLGAADGKQTFGSPAIAVNRQGVLAAMWQKKFRSGCWLFATSADDGKSLSSPKELGTCSEDEMKPSALNSDYLWTSFFQADPKNPNSTARINLRNTRNADWRDVDAIGVTPDGEFHPVWIDAGKGSGEIRTAAVRVTPAAVLVADATKGMKDVTSQVAVLYGGDQSYDEKTGMLTLDVTIKNMSDQPLTGPFRLAVTSLYKSFGYANVANAENGATDAGSVWDIARSIPAGTLAPGASTRPFPLKFSYHVDPDLERGSDDILGLGAKVYAAGDKDAAKQVAAIKKGSPEQRAGQQ
jgi:hypothetical protein